MNVAPAIAAAGLSLTYPNGIRALHDVSLSIAPGEFVAVIGPNGSGKSSLLRVLAGLQRAQTGEVLLEGQSIATLSSQERARRVALVPQALEVLPGYSVEDFVLLGRYAHLKGWRLYSKHDREVAMECLKQVDAQTFVERAMNEMSGGERQRALVARALAQEARTILLDEPTSALDLKHQLLVYRLIHRMHEGPSETRGDVGAGVPARRGLTIVVVTHDLNLASQFADRLILLQDGRIAAEGPPADVLRPEVLEKVYEAELAYGSFERAVGGDGRPWVLPWARP